VRFILYYYFKEGKSIMKTATAMMLNDELTTDKIADLYLDYVNNFLTVETFATWHGLKQQGAKSLINKGRQYHENRIKDGKV
tara:strand:- start:1422 stop:1667 length:246 start_codon:yes stop_codon:yes gene_type:complete